MIRVGEKDVHSVVDILQAVGLRADRSVHITVLRTAEGKQDTLQFSIFPNLK
mgnify:CR=1 FL=1